MGADTGPADSADTDSDPSTASTLGPANILRGDVAADGAVSLGSMSLSATSPRARDRVYGYAISDNQECKSAPTSKFKFKYLLIYYANKMAAETKVKLIFKSETKFPAMHSLSAKTHDSSNYCGQLKSIDNGGNNSDSNGRSSPTTSDRRINQPTTIEADNQR